MTAIGEGEARHLISTLLFYNLNADKMDITDPNSHQR